MPFTIAQNSAINERNCSLLVSAGAGSGKTSVLTERIIERLCDENDTCCITDFIIVTFTKAAAKEMADRIRKKLQERVCDDVANKKILRNLSLLNLAKICTIDSFCFDLVKSNFQKLGLSASLRMIDEAQADVVRTRIANEVVDDAFSCDDGETKNDFLLAYEIFSSAKSDEGFVETLLNLEQKISNCANASEFMRMSLEKYDQVIQKEEFFDTFYGKLLCEYVEKTLNKGICALSDIYELSLDGDVLEAKYAPCIEQDMMGFENILSKLALGYDNVREAVSSFSKASLGAIRNYDDVALKDRIKNTKNNVCDNIIKKVFPMFSADSQTIRLCAEDCKRVIGELFRLVKDIDKRYKAYKNSLGMLDYSDCAHLALGLLTDSVVPFVPSELALSMRKQYKEVYIDEYQDVNELQDMIFLAISGTDENGTENSRFMVGDIKQSIYGFRGARPDIFSNYRNLFDDVGNTSSRKRIFMSNNFRCSESVIDLTNNLFRYLLGKSYTENDELIYSKSEQSKVTKKAQLLFFDTDGITDQGEIDKATIEAFGVGKQILELVNNPKHLSSEGKMYSFSDVAVMTRGKNVHEAYERVFSQMGIPVFADAGESFYSRREIKLFLCILNSIDNPERDIYLAGFLRSCVVGFSDDELCIIKNASKNSGLYTALQKYVQENEGKELCEKCKNFIARLLRYRALSRSRNAAELVWEIYTDTDLLNVCTSKIFGCKSVEEAQNSRKNLMKLYNLAENYTRTSFRGIGDFLEYIDGCKSKDDTKADRILSDSSVQLMTIHRSKGLEFPICFISDTMRKFNHMDEDKPIMFSYDNGVAVKLRDTKDIKCQKSATGNLKIETPFRSVLRLCERENRFEEEMRVLYVATTRAKDVVYITACAESKKIPAILTKAYENAQNSNFSSADNYLEAILNCIAKSDVMSDVYEKYSVSASLVRDGFSNCLEVKVICANENEELFAKDDYVDEQKEQAVFEKDEVFLDKLYKKDAFEYASEVMTKIPSKLTVSMLKSGLLDDEQTKDSSLRDLQTTPSFLEEYTKPSGAERGTALHMFMQFADYKNCENGCESEADRLFENGFIDSRQREILDIKKLDKFFSTDFYKLMAKSKKLYRERRFNLLIDASEYTDKIEKGQENVLVQGVVDLYFENQDGTFSVVDFKTDRVDSEDGERVLIERHKTQLKYYCKAVSEIMQRRVSKAYLYSFSLMREIEVEVE